LGVITALEFVAADEGAFFNSLTAAFFVVGVKAAVLEGELDFLITGTMAAFADCTFF
jgi:hypothetical protein